MAQHDMNIANQGFPAFRSDLNNALSAIQTNHSGTSRPTGAVAGQIWLDTTSATNPTLKFFDGTDDISLATIDYSANTVNWLDSTVSADLIGDTSPQLGGMLDVNGNAIGDGVLELLKFIETASAVNELTITNSATENAPELSSTGDDTNIDIKITPKGSGNVVLDGLKYPNADGTADQVLKTDGSGNLSFADASGGGIQWQSTIVTGSTLTAVAGNGYWIDTTSNACTITLPASASVGDQIIFSDYKRTWGTNAITLNTNSLNFQGATSPNPEYNTNGQSVSIVYSGATQGWIPTVDDDVTWETPQPYSADFLVVAGGGGGGGDNSGGSGGGGAGGYRNSYSTESSGGGGSSESSLTFDIGTVYTITVGAGGANGTGNSQGSNGADSSISGTGITTITSSGGGGGAVRAGNSDGLAGGSGGGAGCRESSPSGSGTGGSGTANQGFDGGDISTALNAGGCGGGGAGAVGTNQPSAVSPGTAGGAGLASSITGSSVTRGGGGGGGAGLDGGNAGSGGTGGGGNGASQNPNAHATAGTANTGGGGGGSGNVGSGSTTSANGGSGVVILRMPTASYTGTTSGSPTVTTSGSDTILTFTASGSYTA
jgi:hypothetical protein